MTDSTPEKKDLTIGELASDAPAAFALAMKANEMFVGQPKPTTAVGWVERFGATPGGLVHDAAAAADKIASGPVSFEMVRTLLGLSADGIIGQAGALGEKVAAQTAD